MIKRYFEQSYIDNLLARIDIIDIVEHFIPLKKKGDNHWACCPFHQEKTASFSVSHNKQIYYCFGCGVGGNAISFMMEYDRLSYPEAIEYLANSIGMALPEGKVVAQENSDVTHDEIFAVNQQAMRYFQQQLKKEPAVIEYLKGRQLSGEIAKQYALGFAPDAWHSLEKAGVAKAFSQKAFGAVWFANRKIG